MCVNGLRLLVIGVVIVVMVVIGHECWRVIVNIQQHLTTNQKEIVPLQYHLQCNSIYLILL